MKFKTNVIATVLTLMLVMQIALMIYLWMYQIYIAKLLGAGTILVTAVLILFSFMQRVVETNNIKKAEAEVELEPVVPVTKKTKLRTNETEIAPVPKQKTIPVKWNGTEY